MKERRRAVRKNAILAPTLSRSNLGQMGRGLNVGGQPSLLRIFLSISDLPQSHFPCRPGNCGGQKRQYFCRQHQPRRQRKSARDHKLRHAVCKRLHLSFTVSTIFSGRARWDMEWGLQGGISNVVDLSSRCLPKPAGSHADGSPRFSGAVVADERIKNELAGTRRTFG